MVNLIPALKTDAALLKALQDTPARQLTAGELFEQRVSFVYGFVDSKSDITRDRVRQVISDHEGKSEPTK